MRIIDLRWKCSGAVLVAAVAVLALGACGGDSTTVINNTTTVADDGTTDDTTANDTATDDGYCGDIASGELGVYDVVATAVDCDEALAVAKGWDDGDCYERSSSACDVDTYKCVRSFGDQGATVYCNEEPNDAGGVEFTFHEPGGE